ncbi:Na+/H+ antiporter [Streptomyces sp. NPDC001070]
MEGLALVTLMVGAVLVTAVARRLGVSPPLLLVAVGLCASFVPGIPAYAIEPEVVMVLVLPPLLYSSARESSYLRFRENLRPIGLLAVGLVLFTTVVIGYAASWLVPGLPLGSALVLGAVLSPPDAVAATSIGRRLGLPRRVLTVLGGESLVNDATALTAYRVAIASVAGAGYTLLQGVGVFLLAAVGGSLIGLAIGWLARLGHRFLPGDLASALGLLVPFLAYLVGEEAHTSGVLAVVVSGLYLGHRSPDVEATSRLQVYAVWNALDTVLEALVFALIGLQVRGIVDGVDTGVGRLVAAGAALTAVTVLARIVWVYPATYLPRFLFPRIRARDPYPPWQYPVVLSWAGMRGVVSLAAAFALPETTDSGAPFPGRDEILFLTFFVTVATLLLHGMTLPPLIRRLGICNKEAYQDALAEASAQHSAARAALARLEELAGNKGSHQAVLETLRQTAEARRNAAWERLGGPTGEGAEPPSVAYRRLRRAMLEAERQEFVRFRDERLIDDEVLRRVMRELDLEEAALQRE